MWNPCEVRSVLLLLSAMGLAHAQERPMPTDLHKAVTLYASFDEAVRADVAGGERTVSTRMNHESQAGQFVFQPVFDDQVFRIAAGRGIAGGALAPSDVLARNGR